LKMGKKARHWQPVAAMACRGGGGPGWGAYGDSDKFL
jgi:hypothetical protein